METCFSSLLYVIVKPLLKKFVTAVQEGDRFDDWEEPDEVRKGTNSHHVGMNHLHVIVNDAVFEHVERLSKCQIAHDIKAVKMEPLGYIQWRVFGFIDLFQQLVGVY